MHQNLILRQETNDDLPKIFAVNHLAFEQDGEARLVDALRGNDDAFVPELSIVAVLENEIVGHILFTKIQIIEGEAEIESLALEPMAVLPEHQNHGIGEQLVQRGLNTARSLGYKSVTVLGHEYYYPRFGFVPTTIWNIRAPFDVPPNVFMGLELVEYALENVTGIVRYPKEFDEI